MHKCLIKELEDRVLSFCKVNHPQFKRQKTLPKNLGASLLLVDQVSVKFKRYIHIGYVPNKDFLHLNVMWSRTGSFPDEFCLEGASINNAMESVDDLRACDEAWLSCQLFGRPNYIDLGLKEPDDIFIRKIYSEENARELLDYQADSSNDVSLSAFMDLVALVGWDILFDCFGAEILDKEDYDRILGETVENIIEFIDNDAIPLLNRIG